MQTTSPQFCFISQYCADDVGVAAGLFFSCLAKNIHMQSDCWLHSRSCRCSTSCCKVSYSIVQQFKDLLLCLVIFNVVGFLYQLLWRICYTDLWREPPAVTWTWFFLDYIMLTNCKWSACSCITWSITLKKISGKMTEVNPINTFKAHKYEEKNVLLDVWTVPHLVFIFLPVKDAICLYRT